MARSLSRGKKAEFALKLTTAIVIVSGSVGTIAWFDNRYTLASEQKKFNSEFSLKLRKVQIELMINRAQNTLQSSLDNYYFHKKKIRQYPSDVEIVHEYHKAESEVEKLKLTVNDLRKKRSQMDIGI